VQCAGGASDAETKQNNDILQMHLTVCAVVIFVMYISGFGLMYS